MDDGYKRLSPSEVSRMEAASDRRKRAKREKEAKDKPLWKRAGEAIGEGLFDLVKPDRTERSQRK